MNTALAKILDDAPNEPKARWQPKGMRWWYGAIADWMMANPGGDMIDCAAALGRSVVAIRLIASSDTFKNYYSQRRAAFVERHDQSLVTKMHEVAVLHLDIITETMRKKRDATPLPILQMGERALDRLGYGGKAAGPGVSVNVVGGATQVVVAPVSREDLAAARDKLRAVGEQKSQTKEREPSAVSSPAPPVMAAVEAPARPILELTAEDANVAATPRR